MSTINGMGTKIFRQSEYKEDGTYIGVKWFVLGFPLFPLAAYIVKEYDTNGTIYNQTTKYGLQRISLSRNLVLPIVLRIWGIIISVIIVFYILSITKNIFLIFLLILCFPLIIGFGISSIVKNENIKFYSDMD
jgi:hypothetical protein